MSYIALYRKYRPKSFSDVYGQDIIVKTLKNLIKNDKLSHAYLFTGPRGTGKTSCAKLFSKVINCNNPVDGDACNECENCKIFNSNQNPDIIEIDAASNNGVDEIREIKNNSNLVPSFSKYKVYIIDEVHMLSQGAFNALLKTLEEPPKHVIFILATTDPQKMPSTVISRCQRYDFNSISNEKVVECLEKIVNNESIKIETDALMEIALSSSGGLRDAIGLLDQVSNFNEEIIQVKDVDEITGNLTAEELTEFINDINQNKLENVITKISNFQSNGKNILKITNKINYILKELLYYKKTSIKRLEEYYYRNIDNLKEIDLIKYIENFIEVSSKLKNSPNDFLLFELSIFKLLKNNNLIESEIKIEKDIKNSNVSRETLESSLLINQNENKQKTIDVSRETSIQEDLINKVKEIRINNILLKASKEEISIIKNNWNNLEQYLIDSKYKLVAGLLINATAVAASNSGIIITYKLENELDKIEKNYEQCKSLITQIFGNNYKIVNILEDYWQRIRPLYAKKVKEGKLEYIDEEEKINEIKKLQKNNTLSEFNDLIEMEEL